MTCCFTIERTFSRRAVVSYWRKYVHEVLVNRLGGLSLPRKSVVGLTDRPDMTLDVYRGRKTTMQQQQQLKGSFPRMGSTLQPLYYYCFTYGDTRAPSSDWKLWNYEKDGANEKGNIKRQ